MDYISKLLHNICNIFKPHKLEEVEEPEQNKSNGGMWIYFDPIETETYQSATDKINLKCDNCKFLHRNTLTHPMFKLTLLKGVIECKKCHRRYTVRIVNE